MSDLEKRKLLREWVIAGLKEKGIEDAEVLVSPEAGTGRYRVRAEVRFFADGHFDEYLFENRVRAVPEITAENLGHGLARALRDYAKEWTKDPLVAVAGALYAALKRYVMSQRDPTTAEGADALRRAEGLEE